mmetsp:Transcript_49677/g.153472  ORF Transcript_49677/g.153472 Transcript_49677/m.153472 type:complete len:240 (+) Transcript_49677:336-1055(+)
MSGRRFAAGAPATGAREAVENARCGGARRPATTLGPTATPGAAEVIPDGCRAACACDGTIGRRARSMLSRDAADAWTPTRVDGPAWRGAWTPPMASGTASSSLPSCTRSMLSTRLFSSPAGTTELDQIGARVSARSFARRSASSSAVPNGDGAACRSRATVTASSSSPSGGAATVELSTVSSATSSGKTSPFFMKWAIRRRNGPWGSRSSDASGRLVNGDVGAVPWVNVANHSKMDGRS